jgi:hypothetical protein
VWLSRFTGDEKPDPSLPEMVELNDERLAREVYALEETFEWRYLPSELMGESEALMDDLVTMRWLAGKIKANEDDHG